MSLSQVETPILIMELRKRIGAETYLNYRRELDMLATDIEIEGKDAYYAKEHNCD